MATTKPDKPAPKLEERSVTTPEGLLPPMPVSAYAPGGVELKAIEGTTEPPDSDHPIVPTLEQLASDPIFKHFGPKELELLAGMLLKRAGRAGKSPTGKHVVKTGIKVLGSDGKAIRLGKGTVVELSPEDAKHFEKHGAVEPEYA